MSQAQRVVHVVLWGMALEVLHAGNAKAPSSITEGTILGIRAPDISETIRRKYLRQSAKTATSETAIRRFSNPSLMKGVMLRTRWLVLGWRWFG
jgi:hypothetical protein